MAAMALTGAWQEGGDFLPTDDGAWPVLICMLGPFRLLKAGSPIALRSEGKGEALLSTLALRHGHGAPRETLLETLWPDRDATLANQSLNSLVYSLHRSLGDAIGGARPVLFSGGYYRLNAERGIGVDVACFDTLTKAGKRQTRAGNREAAAEISRRAVRLYRGDLRSTADVNGIVERERLRALYLTLLANLADYHFTVGDYLTCLDNARRLLAGDPCREDAHRMVMRCNVRRGERGQALRQFRLCEEILRTEFNATPEPATTALFEQLRLDPNSV